MVAAHLTMPSPCAVLIVARSTVMITVQDQTMQRLKQEILIITINVKSARLEDRVSCAGHKETNTQCKQNKQTKIKKQNKTKKNKKKKYKQITKNYIATVVFSALCSFISVLHRSDVAFAT